MRTPVIRLSIAVLMLAALAAPSVAQDSIRALADPAAARGFLADLSELYAQQRGRSVTVEAAPSEAVLTAIVEGEADFGAVSRPYMPTRLSEAGMTFQPVAWDAVVVIVHRDNPILNLSLKQAVAIFSGQTTSWAPLGAGDGAIEVVTVDSPNQADGLEHVFTQLLMRGTSGIVSSRRVADSAAVEQFVASNRNAIGITSYGSARRVMEVKMLGIEGQPAAVPTIRSGAYLLYTPLYLVRKPGGENRRIVSDLMRFSSQGSTAQVLRRVGIIPYTDGMALLAGQLDRDTQIELLLR